ncbi:hypothetical protein U9M48_005037, partial [Paspalum notatum var. saurae]
VSVKCRCRVVVEEPERRRSVGSRTHGDPIELDGVPVSDPGTGTGSTALPAGSSAAGAARRSRKRSKCWNDFDEVTNVVNGKTVRCGAVCKYCKSNLSAESASGIGHLLRHNCPAKQAYERSGQVQFVLKMNADVAFILDPRAKMRGFNRLLVRLSSLFGKDYSRFPIDVRTKLTKIFHMYESKFGDARQRAAHQLAAHGSGKKKMAWGDIYDDDDIGGFPSTPLGRRLGSSSSSPHSLSTVASTSKLASYLDSDILTEFDEDFNILSWWQKHKLTYPILSLLAKDVLIVPASTISSESTFSLAGRVIEERRRRLTPDMVEVLSCIKDWKLADTLLQHSVEEETNELEEVHENMYLDVDDAAKDEG